MIMKWLSCGGGALMNRTDSLIKIFQTAHSRPVTQGESGHHTVRQEVNVPQPSPKPFP